MSLKQKSQTQFNCDVCKINISTEAEYALHEFSKKHCDNLLRIAKNKPIVSKQKTKKLEIQTINKDEPKTTVVTTKGNFAKYGYFVQGEIYDTNADSKEFNTEYDPYLQKYCKNQFNEPTQSSGIQDVLYLTATKNMTSFKRKKKKKIRKCEICDLTLQTVPEYEAHLKSPQHSWSLKSRGMGVSAHFVKASSDLHTIEVNEDSTCKDIVGTSCTSENSETNDSQLIFPTLYCDICELLLNSKQQYNTHVTGKSHNDNVQKKAEIRAKKHQFEKVCHSQLYCFSCKVPLNNLQQYREHKFGKKHKRNCRRLMQEGITIPPEERITSWEVPRVDPKKPVVYPEMYEKFKNETQQLNEDNDSNINNINSPNNYYCQNCAITFSNFSLYESHINSEDHQRLISSESQKLHGADHTPKNPLHEDLNDNEQIKEVCIIGLNETFKCSVCDLNFTGEGEYEFHLTTEDHARKILKLKRNCVGNEEILNKLIKDRSVVQLDNFGRYTCCMCLVTAGGIVECRQHLSSVVHKQMEEEFKKKREIELNSMIEPDELGNFTCKLCREDFTTLTNYNCHLHTLNHKEELKMEKARKLKIKNRLLLQHKRVKQKYFISGLKRKDFGGWRKNCEKNPCLRTKVPERNLTTNHEDITPNAEPKFDSSREESANKRKFEETSKCIKHKRWNMEVSEPYKTVKSLMTMNCRLPFSPQPPPLMSKNIGNPYQPQYFRPNFFPGLPNKPRGHHQDNNYRQPCIFRPSRTRYYPCYN